MASVPPSSWLVVKERSPEDFLFKHGLSGRVGLFGGAPLGHKFVRWGQAPITADGRWSLWSHAVIFAIEQGRRVLYESDFDVRLFPPRLRNGAQMSPIDKYFSPHRWPYMCVLDFGLSEAEAEKVIDACRMMVRQGVRYALFGLVRTGLYYRLGPRIRVRPPKHHGELFCSAFVQKAFSQVGIQFQDSIPLEHLGPEHIWQTAVPHVTYIRHKEWEALRRRRWTSASPLGTDPRRD